MNAKPIDVVLHEHRRASEHAALRSLEPAPGWFSSYLPIALSLVSAGVLIFIAGFLFGAQGLPIAVSCIVDLAS